jgi:NADH-quinone oxidoreductase subunit C
MASDTTITDLEQLKDCPEVSRLAQKAGLLQSAKLDRGELTVWVQPATIVEACSILRDSAETQFNFLSDITCIDWYPSEPRFEVVYHLLSHSRKARVRVKVKLDAENANVDSLTKLWAGADFFEREIYDLFGVRFQGHPNLKRIMMPEDWEGHPLRKDYPVEGYR